MLKTYYPSMCIHVSIHARSSSWAWYYRGGRVVITHPCYPDIVERAPRLTRQSDEDGCCQRGSSKWAQEERPRDLSDKASGSASLTMGSPPAFPDWRQLSGTAEHTTVPPPLVPRSIATISNISSTCAICVLCFLPPTLLLSYLLLNLSPQPPRLLALVDCTHSFSQSPKAAPARSNTTTPHSQDVNPRL